MVIKREEAGERKSTHLGNRRGTGGDPGEARSPDGDTRLGQGEGQQAMPMRGLV